MNSGDRFGDLTFISFERSNARRQRYGRFKCDCGGETVALVDNVRRGQTKSCGCQRNSKKRLPPGQAALNFFYDRSRRGALRRRLPFELTIDDYCRIAQQPCAYCGAPPQPKKQRTNYSAFVCNGVDRVNNFQGYTISNCAACCAVCNTAKSTMSVDEFRAWVGRVHAHFVVKP